jgi:caspase domain-containing protein
MTATPLLLLAVIAAAAAEAPRRALLVGNEAGVAGEAPLRSTGTDAERLAAVLTELGGFGAADVMVLKDRTAAEILDAIDAIAAREPASVFVFYYSGHGDAGALHPAGTLLPVDLLLHRLRAVRAELRIGILDACQSGGAARRKGSIPAAPFEVRLDDHASAGDILVTSSAADELSFETEGGGLFTLHWTAGLRGAADANGDGQVTLGEVYEYAYAQTLRATLVASSGPQHAMFRYELAGRRDPVLTRLAGASLLTLQPASDGAVVIFDGSERSVVAEVPVRPGVSRRLALPPGSYVVRQRSTSSLRVARIELRRGDDRVLLERQMQDVPLVRLARKGSPGDRRAWVAAGQYGSGLGPRGQVTGQAGLEWEGARWLTAVDLGVSAGDETHADLTTRDVQVQVSGSALYALRAGTAAFRFGPAAGLAWLRQDSEGHDAVSALGFTAGLRVRGDVAITQGLLLFASIDGRTLVAPTTSSPPGPSLQLGRLGIVPWLAYAAGVGAAF